MIPSAPTPPSTATPSQAFTGSAFETGRRTSSSLPPGRRVTVVRPGYLPPSCCLPSTHPPASVKPCRQGRARASGRGGVEEADDVLRVGRRLKGLLVGVWAPVIGCRKAGARVRRSSLPEKFKLPGRKGASLPLPAHSLYQPAAWQEEYRLSLGGCDLLGGLRPTAAFTSGSDTSVDVQQVGGGGGQDTPEKRFVEDDHRTWWSENQQDLLTDSFTLRFGEVLPSYIAMVFEVE